MDSALRPRDIQARIRGGETAEAVAAAAGTPVEKIMPFAAPVLAERAHVAQTALRSSVRRGSGPSHGARTLGEAVEQFLLAHALREDDVAWDAWRRPDGRWALTAELETGGRSHTAEFTHDVAGRYVVADNDDARLLTGELQPEGETDAAPRPLTALSGGYADAPLGDDAIELVRDQPQREPQPEPQPEPHSALPPEPEPEPEPDEQPEQPDPHDRDQPALDLDVPERESPQDEAPRRSRKGRASVPSWDEIMFGGPKD